MIASMQCSDILRIPEIGQNLSNRIRSARQGREHNIHAKAKGAEHILQNTRIDIDANTQRHRVGRQLLEDTKNVLDFVLRAYKHNKVMAKTKETTNPIAEAKGPKPRWDSAWTELCCHGRGHLTSKIFLPNARAAHPGAQRRCCMFCGKSGMCARRHGELCLKSRGQARRKFSRNVALSWNRLAGACS
jgi:hypothetical protein